eukprot:14367875-Ditylum_brightwellii.AAC.1
MSSQGTPTKKNASVHHTTTTNCIEKHSVSNCAIFLSSNGRESKVFSSLATATDAMASIQHSFHNNIKTLETT